MTTPDWTSEIVEAMAKALHEQDVCCDDLDDCENIETYYNPLARAALAAASTGGEESADSQDLSGWIMGDSEGRRWRGWGNYGPTWQTDPMKAIRFARREDAEAVFAEDEDAWTVIELVAAIRSQKDGE